MSEHSHSDTPFTRRFFDKNNTTARHTYLRIFITGCFLVIIVIFAVFSIYWGALWKTPLRNLHGSVVDFDGGLVGQAVVQGLINTSSLSRVTWTPRNASEFPGGLRQLGDAVIKQETWVAIAINSGTTARLQSSYVTPNASYNGSDAITVLAAEARNENAYRNLIRPSVETSLAALSQAFALQSSNQLVSSPNLTSLLSTSPQTVITPIWFTINDLVPFNVPVATAVTFVGLIYALILSFFVVAFGYTARDVSGLNKYLTLRSLIITRFISSFGAFFFLSLFYALLSLAFQVDFNHRYGTSGFVIFWMLNWVGMLAVGLALEALITLLTSGFIPFFMILWIIANVSVSLNPIEVLPEIYRYGYAMPFYNVSHAIRSIIFGTKNTLGLNFGVLIAWTAISCITMPLIQWFVRRRDVIAEGRQKVSASGEKREV